MGLSYTEFTYGIADAPAGVVSLAPVREMIAQVTTTDNGGTFSGLLQGKDANGDTWSANVSGAAYGGGDIPAPGALALLGLAGVAGRRRRRA